MRSKSKNIEMLAVVAKGLKGLKEKVVFVGGSTIDLHLGPGGPASRATDDVDCVVEIATRIQYHQFEEKLRGLGFEHPMGEKVPICRWKFCGIQVDVMPTEGMVLGFNNKWYRDGMANAEDVKLPDGQVISAFSVPYLLASKLEAFGDRGKKDFLASPDIEDVVSLFDGCPNIKEKIQSAPEKVREYLVIEMKKLLANEVFLMSLEGHLGSGPNQKERVERLISLLKDLTGS